MRTYIALSLAAALTLAGCTVIPPADPSRTPATYYPAPARAQTYAPQYTRPTAPPQAPDYASPSQARPQPEVNTLTWAALNQTVTVDGPRVTPLEVLEDSRCPMNARCVWAGQLRLRVRIESGTGGTVELTTGKPAHVADGTLELVGVQPDKMTGTGNHGAVALSEYRFGLRFMGGY